MLLVWSSHCGASKDMMPAFDAISKTYGATVRFAKVDVEENQEIAPYSGFPWVFVIKDGILADAQTGAYGGTAGQKLNERGLRHVLARNSLIGEQPDTLLREFPADLIRPNMEDRILTSVDLRGADLSGKSFARAQLTGARMTNTNLSGTNFSGAFLQHANLRGARVDERTNFAGAYFLNTICPDGTIATQGEKNASCASR